MDDLLQARLEPLRRRKDESRRPQTTTPETLKFPLFKRRHTTGIYIRTHRAFPQTCRRWQIFAERDSCFVIQSANMFVNPCLSSFVLKRRKKNSLGGGNAEKLHFYGYQIYGAEEHR